MVMTAVGGLTGTSSLDKDQRSSQGCKRKIAKRFVHGLHREHKKVFFKLKAQSIKFLPPQKGDLASESIMETSNYCHVLKSIPQITDVNLSFKNSVI